MPLSDKQKRHYEILGDRNLKRAERLRRMRLSSNIVSVSNDVKWLKIFDDLQSQLECDTTCNIKL